MRRFAAILLLTMALFPGLLLAAEEEEVKIPGPAPPGSPAGEVTVNAVIDGERLILGDDRRVHLAAIRAPFPPFGRQTVRWPPIQLAGRRIIELGKEGFQLYPTGASDRYASQFVNLWSITDQNWLAVVLAGEGLVMAAPRALSDPAYAPVAAAEARAREEGLGIWSNPLHRVLCAAQAGDGLDQYRVVMGKLLGVGETRGTLYLNFGPDWKTDFTVRLRLRSKVRRAEARKQAEAWVGGWLEVRGWLHFFSGPMIDVTSFAGLRTLTPEGSVERDLKRCQG